MVSFSSGLSPVLLVLSTVLLWNHQVVGATTSASDCTGNIGFLSDGYCDGENNIEECNYDGGDCCPCTCADSTYSCGVKGYDCQDPTVPATCTSGSSSSTPSATSVSPAPSDYPYCEDAAGHVPYISDGFCDSQNNGEDCGYDGGDCCSCTCVDAEFSCAENGYDCVDPTVSPECVNASSRSIPSFPSTSYSNTAYADCTGVGGYPPFVDDGLCDTSNNNEECEYDGGDCCLCTCKDSEYSCGSSDFDCLDPTVSTACVNASLAYTTSTTDDSTYYSSYYYYYYYYYYSNGEYANCTDDGGYVWWIGDGYCDSNNNMEECDYDGGDCCPCTCGEGSQYNCGIVGYDCEDPTVPDNCTESSSSSSILEVVYPNCTDVGGNPEYIGSGWCDDENNNEECNYDGGDCCLCSCIASGNAYCEYYYFNCLDPNATIDCTESYTSTSYFGEAYPNCTGLGGFLPWIDDGLCDAGNNNDDCGYDGGDCCPCTCEDGLYSCGDNDYDCQDPTVPASCANSSSV